MKLTKEFFDTIENDPNLSDLIGLRFIECYSDNFFDTALFEELKEFIRTWSKKIYERIPDRGVLSEKD